VNLLDITEIEIEKPDFATIEMGYVEPSHGSKGRKVWVYADSDEFDSQGEDIDEDPEFPLPSASENESDNISLGCSSALHINSEEL